MIERKERLTIASEDASTDHLVMSPLTILRILESDKLNTAPEAMDETVITRDEDEWLRNRNAAVWKVLTARMRVAPELEFSFGRLTLPTAQVNQIRLI